MPPAATHLSVPKARNLVGKQAVFRLLSEFDRPAVELRVLAITYSREEGACLITSMGEYPFSQLELLDG